MWPSERLTELLGIEHPIIQAPMAGATTPALAAAAANAGGLGSLGCAFTPPDALRKEAAAIRTMTNRAFNLNFFVHAPPRDDPARNARAAELLAPFHEEFGLGAPPPPDPGPPPFGEAQLAVVLEVRPRVASFHFGLPAPGRVAALKEAGILVLSSATTPAEARALEAGGADAIIAQGWEAGGHRGVFDPASGSGQVGTFALVPQVVDAVSVPVIAAGGIADGRGIAAAFALGADGVQIGTAFLTTGEAQVLPPHKAALLAADGDATRITKAFSGRPARGVLNRYMAAMAAHEDDLPDFPLMNGLTGPLRAESAKRGSPDFLTLWSGQAVGLNREMPAAELMATLVDEAQAAMRFGRQS